MTKLYLATALAAALLGAASARAQTGDDLKWIGQCMNDNAGSASASVIRAYCTCMNNKMSDNETRSITQWEKSNPTARRECDRQSGWR